MKNSSVDIVSSKSSLKELEDCFKLMMGIAEEELWVNIEFIHGSNSFWMATPELEIEEDEDQPFGIIEIGDDQQKFYKIVALAHEVGHCLHRKSHTFKDVNDTMFSESVAWFLGYNWFFDRNIIINMDDYQKCMIHALELYRAELE